MTTHLLSASISSLRALADSRRRGHLAGLIRTTADRDLDRISGDLLYLAQADYAPHRAVASAPADAARPVDLDARRARATGGSTDLQHDLQHDRHAGHAGHAQAS